MGSRSPSGRLWQDAMLRYSSAELEQAPGSPPQRGAPDYTPPPVPGGPWGSAPAGAGTPPLPSPRGPGALPPAPAGSRLRAGTGGFETPAPAWRGRGAEATPSTTDYLTPMGLVRPFAWRAAHAPAAPCAPVSGQAPAQAAPACGSPAPLHRAQCRKRIG